jgi:hypothetical protein
MKMELDKRIDDIRVKLMTCFNTDEAKQYLGQQGFFADEIYAYHDLDHVDFRTLDRVDGDHVPFVAGDLCYQFFLPAAYVRPAEEKKGRPFTLDEFRAKFPLLSPVTFKEKKEGIPKTFCFIGYKADGRIILGNNWCSLNNLFENYELQDKDGNWVPFGVEEK